MATALQILQDACSSGLACLNERQLMVVIAQLSSAGGGGGGSNTNYNLQGVVDPTSDPPDTTKTWTYTNTITLTFWVWSIPDLTWLQIV